tara:strand:- start:358 stop:675 length:318 start_codon:yes stop_codon:yes gene_type:complete
MKEKKYLYLLLIIFFNLIFYQAKSDELLKNGKDIFLNKANCASCHMLKDAGSNGQIGPNLDEIRPEKNRVIVAVTNGIGVMPAYQGQLTVEEIEAVSYYVSKSVN